MWKEQLTNIHTNNVSSAKTQKIEHNFVEQEAFDMPWKESLNVDAEYMRALKR